MSAFDLFHFVERSNLSYAEARDEWNFMNVKSTEKVLYKNVRNYIKRNGNQLILPYHHNAIYYFECERMEHIRKNKPYIDYVEAHKMVKERVKAMSKDDKKRLERRYDVEPRFVGTTKYRRMIMSLYLTYLLLQSDVDITNAEKYVYDLSTIFRKAMLLCRKPLREIEDTMKDVINWLDTNKYKYN